MGVLCFRSHANFVEEELNQRVFGGSIGVLLVQPIVHDLDGHTLLGRQVDAQLYPACGLEYLEKRPKPSRKSTRYLSSMTGQRSRYSLGSSREEDIDNKFGIKLL